MLWSSILVVIIVGIVFWYRFCNKYNNFPISLQERNGQERHEQAFGTGCDYQILRREPMAQETVSCASGLSTVFPASRSREPWTSGSLMCCVTMESQPVPFRHCKQRIRIMLLYISSHLSYIIMCQIGNIFDIYVI